MKRIALLQFHRDWDVCENRLRLLQAFNPDLRIYGLFGGEKADLGIARALFRDPGAVWYLSHPDPRWKWQNTDLAVREWYRSFGHEVPFDVLHLVQWDLLFFDSLENLYARVPQDAVGLTGITSIQAIADRWHWTLNEPHSTELLQLGDVVSRRFHSAAPSQACLGPGYCLPRTFLDRYAAVDIPELGHDELRLPLFARLFGFPVTDTGFYPHWFDAEEERYFNANSDEIDESLIRAELTRPGGRRVFHPFRRVWEGPEVEALFPRPGFSAAR